MSIHQVNICGFAQMLRALRGQLDKADAHALTTGYSSRDLLSARLAPDMYPLAKQIQFACIQAREAVCRLTGQPLPVLCTPGDMDQARELIDETLDHSTRRWTIWLRQTQRRSIPPCLTTIQQNAPGSSFPGRSCFHRLRAIAYAPSGLSLRSGRRVPASWIA